MAQDIIARLKADTSQWDSGLSRAGRSLNQFKQQNLSMEGVLNQQVKTLLKVGAQYASYGAAISGAMKVAKDAFFTSEQSVDEWGRTMESAKELYEGFCSALNNSSLSSFFDNIDNIVAKAREAYNALDDLQTKGGIISNKEAKLNYQRSQLMNIINDKSKSEAERKAAQEQLTALSGQMRDAKLTTSALNENVVNTKIAEKLTQAGFKEGTKEYGTAFARVIKSLYDENYNMGTVNTGFESGPTINNGKTIRRLDNGNRNLDNIITDEFRNEIKPYVQAAWSSLQAAEDAQRMNNRFAQKSLGSGGGGGGSSSFGAKLDVSAKELSGLALGQTESMKELNAELSKYKNLLSEAKTAAEQAFAQQSIEQVQKQIEVQPIALSLGVSTDEIVSIKDQIEKTLNDNPIQLLPIDPTHITRTSEVIADEAKDVKDSWSGASKAIGAASSALSQIEDPGAKIAGIIGEALATLASTYAASLKGTITPWDWMAAAISGATTLASVSSIMKKNVEYHANGGKVGQGPFIPRGTDTVAAMLTPGEVVLNAAQQRNVASNLQGSNNIHVSGGDVRFSGEDMFYTIKAFMQRTGSTF